MCLTSFSRNLCLSSCQQQLRRGFICKQTFYWLQSFHTVILWVILEVNKSTKREKIYFLFTIVYFLCDFLFLMFDFYFFYLNFLFSISYFLFSIFVTALSTFRTSFCLIYFNICPLNNKLTPWLMESGDPMPHSQGLSNNLYSELNQHNSSY